jgi:hypothetical protein
MLRCTGWSSGRRDVLRSTCNSTPVNRRLREIAFRPDAFNAIQVHFFSPFVPICLGRPKARGRHSQAKVTEGRSLQQNRPVEQNTAGFGEFCEEGIVMLRRRIGKEILTRQREDDWETKVIEHPALS